LKTKGKISNGTITINGQKRWMSGAGYSDMVLFLRLGSGEGAKGIGAVYVPADTPGIKYGTPEKLMGFRGIPSADIFFDNVQVPVENLLVEAGGFAKLMEIFDLERCGSY
jgi:alkylation response protein AidB-like acyl-CoA dehydrogenase